MKIDFEKLKIKEYEYWNLYLNEYQCYLGRTCLVAKRPDAIDFIAMTRDEREEFFSIGQTLNQALKTLFQPDLMNYASMGNVYNHLHVHLIPRYKERREFNGITFEDKRWGKNYAPYDRTFELTLDQLLHIKEAIKSNLTVQMK
jgi:diadenosine tetraphosphate (Ap4A) HIT family hydrolase